MKLANPLSHCEPLCKGNPLVKSPAISGWQNVGKRCRISSSSSMACVNCQMILPATIFNILSPSLIMISPISLLRQINHQQWKRALCNLSRDPTKTCGAFSKHDLCFLRILPIAQQATCLPNVSRIQTPRSQ